MSTNYWEDSDPLCCCEYMDSNQERNHILACCCNCQELDESCDSLSRCQRVPLTQFYTVMMRIQDRMRIPWKGGAKQLTIDSLLPAVILPVLGVIAAQSLWCTVVVFFSLPFLINFMHKIFRKTIPRTKFFLMWSICTIVLLWSVFEILVVPLLEILPEENLVLMALLFGAIFCIYRIKKQALQQTVTQSSAQNNEIGINIDEKENLIPESICEMCKTKMPNRAFHCSVCQACVMLRDRHCVWLDCCIGERNRSLFILFLILTIATLIFGSNLTLTTVCHPFTLYKTILLPDDCSDVYYEFDMALCFISAVYSLLIAVLLLGLLIQQLWLISLGLTGSELKHYGRICACCAVRPYSKGFIRNWYQFLCKKNLKY